MGDEEQNSEGRFFPPFFSVEAVLNLFNPFHRCSNSFWTEWKT